jgi:formate dehydrogenase subunit gamma
LRRSRFGSGDDEGIAASTVDGPARVGTEDARQVAVREIAQALVAQAGALLPVLHDVRARFGSISREDVTVIADVLNLSIAQVHGVVTFYRDFRAPSGGAVASREVMICRGEACQAVGAQALFDDATTRFSGSGTSVAEVFCLGNCALGPSAMIDGRLHGRLTADRLSVLTDSPR